jgi:inhibitor of KinA sporulation pathway (predicted exonuclease)
MFIILDTEYTSWPGTNEKGYNMKTKFPELVQISAIKVDKDFNIVDRLNIYVKPIINPKLSEYFKRLTKINQNKINKDGISIKGSIEKLYNFSKHNNKLLDVYSYGDDYKIIDINLDIIGDSKKSKYRKWRIHCYDVRYIFKNHNIDTSKYSSGTIYRAFKIKPDKNINIHDSRWDTYSIYISLKYISDNKY